jgi:hypothetical protein
MEQSLKEFLSRQAREHQLSSAEAETLILAWETPIGDIAEQLNLSPNAVQKRLGEVYSKFKVSGNAPGKLDTLKKTLYKKYLRQRKQTVLIAWGDYRSQKIAISLTETVLGYPQIDCRTCSLEELIDKKRWNEENFNSVVVCLFPGDAENIWMTFQIGFLSGQVENLRIIAIDEGLKDNLNKLPRLKVIDGSQKNQLENFLAEITTIEQTEAQRWVSLRFKEWCKHLEAVKAIINRGEIEPIEPVFSDLEDIKSKLKYNKYFQGNFCLKAIINYSVKIACGQLLHLESEYRIQASLYPNYLIYLQKNFPDETEVKAIALLNEFEKFWIGGLGDKICWTTNPNSLRVFIVTNPETRDYLHCETFLKHATRYQVYIAEQEIITNHKDDKIRQLAENISIIRLKESAVLAEYGEKDKETGLKTLCFSDTPAKIYDYEDGIVRMVEDKDCVLSVNEILKEINNSDHKTKVYEIMKRIDMKWNLS